VIGVLYEFTDSIVALGEPSSDIEAMREQLRTLRADYPERRFCLSKAESVEGCKESAAKIFVRVQEDAAALAALPPVRGGEMSQEQWDACMSKMDVLGRHYAANMAAHSWAILPHENGVILVGHGPSASILEGSERVKSYEPVPSICQNCIFTSRYVSTDRHTLICHLAKGEKGDNFRGPSRTVQRASTCDGWKSK
jgi:hypothetical protein